MIEKLGQLFASKEKNISIHEEAHCIAMKVIHSFKPELKTTKMKN